MSQRLDSARRGESSDARRAQRSSSRRRPRGRGRVARGGGGGGGGEPRGGHVSGTQRTFGGALTTSTSELSNQLSPDAAEFVPSGQPNPKGKDKISHQPKPPPAPKSTAPDLPTRIHEDIDNRNYDCAICTNEVLRNSKIWTCSICWTVLHLSCVKRWHTAQMKKKSEAPQQQQQEDAVESWRCPGCNSFLNEEPGNYHCWCGKDHNPRSIAGLRPHSCGQTCSKLRPTCPHPCPLECHAGPCPPCNLMGPTQSCFCGKNSSRKRCNETDYIKGWSCHETCGDLLPCGEHSCHKSCHSGLCGTCEVPMASTCYCGRVEKTLACDRRDDVLESYYHGKTGGDSSRPDGWFEGSFDCHSDCKRSFDCGVHSCSKTCHPQDEDPAHCPFSPDTLLTCPCGKTALSDILTRPRESCQDDVPCCTKKCGKTLDCGHKCFDVCHVGQCSPCQQLVDVFCRCGRPAEQEICHKVDPEPPLCARVCQAQLNCGRHQCGKRCCTGEKKATERATALRRKNKTAQATAGEEDIEAEHICLRICRRPLKCGLHFCQQVCHKGPCSRCVEGVMDDISCACGRTVLEAPQPCGTKPPECRFSCPRRPACGHPQVAHNCHLDDKPCPKCPFLVERLCLCGKQRVKNQPCWFDDVRCGLPCGKKLKCGTHFCKKPCHRPGECEDVGITGSHCKQPCGKTRHSCDHACMDECHAPFHCPENTPCQSKTFITCPCQTRKQEVRCNASLSKPYVAEDVVQLKCDDECLRLQRNQRLASALNIDPATHTDDHVPYSDATLRMFQNLGSAFCQTQEREFRVFANNGAERRLRFKPMTAPRRAFVHSLAQDFGIDSESQDPEPHRHVCIFKTPRFVSAPSKTLAQCAKIRSIQAASTTNTPSLATTTDSTTDESSSNKTYLAAGQPYNALLLTKPQFGLTIDEIERAFASVGAGYPALAFTTSFLPADEVVIVAKAQAKTVPPPSSLDIETWLSRMVGPAQRALVRMVGGVGLCHVDGSLNVGRRDNRAAAGVDGAGMGGWSAVASRAAARPTTTAAAAAATAAGRLNSSFGASQSSRGTARIGSSFVGLKKLVVKKKTDEDSTEEDWLTAAERLVAKQPESSEEGQVKSQEDDRAEEEQPVDGQLEQQ